MKIQSLGNKFFLCVLSSFLNIKLESVISLRRLVALPTPTTADTIPDSHTSEQFPESRLNSRRLTKGSIGSIFDLLPQICVCDQYNSSLFVFRLFDFLDIHDVVA
jgi:hypothetical protein